MIEKKSAIILGASGLIGRELLDRIAQSENFNEVKIFVRKSIPVENQKIKQIITDFKNLDALINEINSEVIFCCLGSTKSKTPDMQEYRRIDLDIPMFFATTGLQNGLQQYHMVTALGANPRSSNFYNKLKGEIEATLKALPIPSIFIYQPSFLEGERNENRVLEKLMLPVMRVANYFLVGSLKKYQSIKGKIVAQAMFNQSLQNKIGIFVFESDKIKEIA